MYGSTRLAKQLRLDIATQHMHLKQACPKGRGEFNQGKKLVWRYETRPTPISRTYTIRIVYKRDKLPNIFVITPKLHELGREENVPHLYCQKKLQLCLYKPGKGEWSPTMSLANTILPWVNLWLFYFEEWLLTGEWKGGGEHPSKVK